jgi:hypothetical protein
LGTTWVDAPADCPAWYLASDHTGSNWNADGGHASIPANWMIDCEPGDLKCYVIDIHLDLVYLNGTRTVLGNPENDAGDTNYGWAPAAERVPVRIKHLVIWVELDASRETSNCIFVSLLRKCPVPFALFDLCHLLFSLALLDVGDSAGLLDAPGIRPETLTRVAGNVVLVTVLRELIRVAVVLPRLLRVVLTSLALQ